MYLRFRPFCYTESSYSTMGGIRLAGTSLNQTYLDPVVEDVIAVSKQIESNFNSIISGDIRLSPLALAVVVVYKIIKLARGADMSLVT